MNLARIPIDLAVAAALYPMAFWVLPRFGRWVGAQPARRPAPPALTVGLCVTDATLWTLNDLGVIGTWPTLVLTVAAALAYGIIARDDDGPGGPRRKVRAALKSVRQCLARGFPAPQPAGAR